MSIVVQIPSSMRRFTENQANVSVSEGGTVAQVLEQLVELHPPLRPHLLTDDGRFYSFIGIFLNSRDIRQLQREATRVGAGDRITLLPAMAGG